MLPVKKLLCPPDFSGPSRAALRVAGEFASHFRAELLLLHVVPVLPSILSDPNLVREYGRLLYEDAAEKLGQVAGEMTAQSATMQTIVRHGDAATHWFRTLVVNLDCADLSTYGLHDEYSWENCAA